MNQDISNSVCSVAQLLDVLFEDGNDQMLRDAVAYLKDKICTPKHIYKMTEQLQDYLHKICLEKRLISISLT